MSEPTVLSTHILHTELGFVVVEVSEVQNFDVEDIVRNKTISLAHALNFVNLGQQVDVNAIKGERTLSSTYTNNSVELTSG